jgi:hypothetical protein
VAPELGDVDRDAVQERVELAGVGAQAARVLGQVSAPAPLDPAANAPLHLGALVLPLERALGERVDGVGAVGGGEGGDHDDRHRVGPAVAQRAQDAESVEARHVQVERERVGPVRAAQVERLVAVGGGPDHVEALAGERVGEHAPNQAASRPRR